MSDGQTLLERCLLLPADATARGALADWLQEHGGDEDLAEAMRGPRGQEYLTELQWESNRIARFPCLKFLWAVVFVIRAERNLDANIASLQSGQLLTLPEGAQVSWPQRPGFFRRLFGG